jgi:uncharacterized repeat protein (TIGR01451 family)
MAFVFSRFLGVLRAAAAAALINVLSFGMPSAWAQEPPPDPPPPTADLAVGKSGPATANIGDNVTYTLTISNSGPDAAANARLRDVIPAGMTFVSLAEPGLPWVCTTPAVGAGGTVQCTNAAFAAGGNATFTLVLNIPAGTAPGTVFTNAVTALTDTVDANEGNNEAFVVTSTPPAPQADLGITKTTPDEAAADTNITYTLTATNGGPDSAANATVSDTLPGDLTFVSATAPAGWTCTTPAVGAGGTVACANPNFAAGGSAIITITAHISPGTPDGTTYTNTATITSSTADPNSENNAATGSTIVVAPFVDFSIAKSHGGNATQGQTGFTYTITVSNVGVSSSSGTVTVSDTLPAGMTATAISGAGWSCSVGATSTCTRSDALAGGASYPPITLTVNVASNAPVIVTNTATVSNSGDSNPSNNTASDQTVVTPPGGLIDLTITKTHSGTARQGQSGFTYTITVSNIGITASAGPVVVSDTLPAGLTATAISGTGWTCTVGPVSTCTRSDTLAPGAAYPPITLIVNVASNAPASVTNTATVSGGGDTNPANNTASDQTNVQSRPDPRQDPDVVGLINAQIAAAQRFANTQISNFNQRLEALHDDERGGDHQGIQIGSPDGDPCARQDPFNPMRGCPQPGGPSAGVGNPSAALAYAPGDPVVNKARPKPLAPRRDFAFWSAGYVSFGSADPTGQRSGIDFTTSGLTAGVDYRFNQYFIAGAGIGYGRDLSKIGVNGTTSRGEAFNAALYGSLRPYRNFFLDAVVGYGALSFDSQRFVVDDAAFVFGHRTGRQLFGSFTGGYTYRAGRLLLSPYARINAAWLTLDQFTEFGGPGALIYSEQTATFMTSVLGLRGRYTFPTNWGSISPRFRIEYNHDFRGNGAASLRYADLLGPTYVLTTEPAERDRMTLGLGTDLQIGETLKLAADYQYDVDFLGAPWHRYRLRLDSRW